MSSGSKVIIALDVEDENEMFKLINSLDPSACRLKVGKTLFTQYGPDWVKQLQIRGFDIFLDLKFHDIPQQVAGACRAAEKLGVWMVNVHALGGLAMLKAARAAVDKTLLIGVTILTSLQQSDLQQMGIQGSAQEAVLRLATLCFEAGLDGVVCSAQEAPILKKTFGSQFLMVTPGIRLPLDDKQDQQRVMTPQEAQAAGSDYLVIGRSITHAAAPIQVLNHINESLQLS